MTYAISIDWLSLYCHWISKSITQEEWQPPVYQSTGSLFVAPFRYTLADYGTRHFERLYMVAMPNEEGGWDDFAEIQCTPHSDILDRKAVIVRFVNRVLYTPNFWELVNRFLTECQFRFRGISRVDICADFNNFATLSPLALVEGFAAKKYRHIGRGVGALYFNHGVTGKDYGVTYTGLSFGTHSSDVHSYLYNKSFELMTVKDKPYIRDLWKRVGLDSRNVWRLEFSFRSKGCKFKDKKTGKVVQIDMDASQNEDELAKIYHTFVRKLFAFVPNRRGITNITQEYAKNGIRLFEDAPAYSRGVIRNVSCGNRIDKIIIKALYLLGDTYRGAANMETADLAQSFAINIAESTDLTLWMKNNYEKWEQPTHK